MFIYLLQKSINKGYISKKEFQPVVEKAYHGIIKKAIMNKKGLIDLIDCSSIGIKNSYADYIDSSKEVSPFSAFGSFILGTSSIEFK
jgi:rhamnogalacturonyl hydrolase YesR